MSHPITPPPELAGPAFDLITRARTALAQQEPPAPTDKELLMTYQHAVSNQVESIIQSIGEYHRTMDNHAAVTLAGLHAVLARFGCPAIERTRPQPEWPKLEPRGCPTPGACSCPTVPTVPPDLIRALEIAEAGLADIGDSDREPGDDLVWAESRAASCLPRIRAVLARWGRPAIEPEPEEPTVMQIIALADEVEAEELGQIDLVRRALTRWGRPAVRPVPIAERLPGPEDCDAEGQSWWYHPETMGSLACWCYSRGNGTEKHWLPHYALPLPQQDGDR